MQRRSKPDPARQYDMHLDGRLTLRTRQHVTSTEPRDIEQLRAKYTVMEILWLLGQMRQPGRSIYSAHAQHLLQFPENLLEQEEFQFQERSGRPTTVPAQLGALPLLRIRVAQGSVQEVPYDVYGHRRSIALHLRRQ